MDQLGQADALLGSEARPVKLRLCPGSQINSVSSHRFFLFRTRGFGTMPPPRTDMSFDLFEELRRGVCPGFISKIVGQIGPSPTGHLWYSVHTTGPAGAAPLPGVPSLGPGRSDLSAREVEGDRRVDSR